MSDNQQFGPWEVKSVLGQGSQGICYLVQRDSKKEEPVFVLKSPKKSHLSRFRSEVETLRQVNELHHPNIITLVDYSLNMEAPYFVSDYYEEGTLKEADYDSWDEDLKYRIYKKICEAVACCHNLGIKKGQHQLQNIFLERYSNEQKLRPVIGDFGASKRIQSTIDITNEMLFLTNIFYQLFENKEFDLTKAYGIK